jgi:hypothetical protein
MVWLVNKISEYGARASGHRDERGVGANAARHLIEFRYRPDLRVVVCHWVIPPMPAPLLEPLPKIGNTLEQS